MANEHMNMGESFEVKVNAGAVPTTQPRHHIIGWALILSLFAAIGYFGWGKLIMDKPKGMSEAPAFGESLQSVKPSCTAINYDYNLTDSTDTDMFAPATPGCASDGGNNITSGTLGFTNAGSNDFTLATTSSAINAGTDVGLGANGTPDMGAFETLGWPSGSPATQCTVEDGDASTLRINVTNNVAPPLQVTDATGWTARDDGGNNAITAITITGSNRVDLTLTDAITAGQTVDFSYAQTGNLTDSANIGGSLVQEALAITNQGCTNNVASPPTFERVQAAYEYHGLRGTEAAPEILGAGENAARMEVALGGKIRIRFALTCTTATCAEVGYKLRYSKNGGGYADVPDAFSTDNIAFCGVSSDADIPGTGSATTEQLSTSGTFVAGLLILNSSTIPTLGLTTAQKTELEYCLAFDTDATGGDTYALRLYESDDTAFTTYTNTPTITLTGVSGGSGF